MRTSVVAPVAIILVTHKFKNKLARYKNYNQNNTIFDNLFVYLFENVFFCSSTWSRIKSLTFKTTCLTDILCLPMLCICVCLINQFYIDLCQKSSSVSCHVVKTSVFFFSLFAGRRSAPLALCFISSYLYILFVALVCVWCFWIIQSIHGNVLINSVKVKNN